MININLDHFQNGSKFLKKVTIDSKKVSTVEVNVSIFSEAVAGAIFDEVVGLVVGAFFCASDAVGSLNIHGYLSSLFPSHHSSTLTHRRK